MNWTGGRLSRHSRTSNPVKDRQKQHFARMQQALHSGPKKHTPFEWSFFDRLVKDHEQSQRGSPATQHRTYRAYGRQESQSIRQHLDHLWSDRNLAQHHDIRHPSRSQEPSHSGQISVPVKKQPSQAPDDDLYSATPQPRKSKRKREGPIPGFEMENLADREEEEESVSEMRRKILRKGDWVGINVQRPLQLIFASPRKEENIGRRRKLTDGYRARYSSKQIHIASPFPTKSRRLANQKSSQDGAERREPARADLRISIGGRVVLPCISSSSAPRRMGSYSTIAHRRSQTSSDVMLLDVEASIAQEFPRMTTSNLVARKYSASVSQITLRSQTFRPMDTSLADEIDQGGHTSSDAEDIRNGWGREFSEAASELHDNVKDSRGLFEVYPQSQKPSLSPSNDYNRDCHPGRLLFSSSSASILHPAPRSSKISVLLRSASSEIAESTVAQVGKVKPLVPSSQILENEIWKTWITPEQKYNQSSDNAYFNENRNPQRVSISPGISTGPAMWHADTIRSESEDEGLSDLQGPHLDEPESGSGKLNMTTSTLSNRRATGSSGLAQQVTWIVENKLEQIGPGVSSVDKELPQATFLTIFPEKVIIEEDQSESWMKFLFGGSNEEVDARIPNQKFNTVSSQREELFGTSMLGQTSADRSVLSDVNSAIQDTNTATAPFKISGGTSRITEASPYPIGSRYRESNMDSPSRPGGISAKAERNFFLASSLDSVPAFAAVQDMSQHSPSEAVESVSQYRSRRKATFTKPKPFIGRKANLDTLCHREPLHIGQSLMKDDERIGSRRKRERDIRGLARSNEQDDQEVESIEDD